MSGAGATVLAVGLTTGALTVITCGAVLGGWWRIATAVVVAILIAALLAATWAENKNTTNTKEKNHV